MTIVLNTEFDEFQHFRVILTKDHTKTDATESCFLILEMLKFVEKDGLNCKNSTYVPNTSNAKHWTIGKDLDQMTI